MAGVPHRVQMVLKMGLPVLPDEIVGATPVAAGVMMAS